MARRALLCVMLLTLLLLTGESTALAADGDLDTTFGDPNVDNTVRALALQSDGKIVIGGSFLSVGGATRYRVARLNTNGSRDDTFGDPNVNGDVIALRVQSDGKIVIGGNFSAVDGQTRNNAARLNANGTRDDTFNNPAADGYVRALALQADGKVLLGGGFQNVGGAAHDRVARLSNAKPTAVTLSTFDATAPSFDLWRWVTIFGRR